MAQCLVIQNNFYFNISVCFTGEACMMIHSLQRKKEKISAMDKEKLLAKLAANSMTGF
jgi:hypothetical protein